VEGTVVFTDIVGFTEFTALRGDAEALTLLLTQERLVREELGNRGRIVKELGDGLMLWFGDACDAVATGLALQERFEAHSAASDLPLWVRIGVHAGRQARRGDDLVGHDVNVAARVVQLAGVGEVVVSEATVEKVGSRLPGVTFDQLGPAVMKGIPGQVVLYRALRAPGTNQERTPVGTACPIER
jgi:adenylate cyclase